VSAPRPPGGKAPPGVVQEILQRQRAKKIIAEAQPRLGTAYETAALLMELLLDARVEERLLPMEALLLELLLEEIVAKAHAEGAEVILENLEQAIRSR
jgi:hypothetical protein